MSKPSLLAWEQGVDNRFNTSVDQSFEDLVGDTEQGDGTEALWVLYRFLWLWDRNYKCSSPDFGNFETQIIMGQAQPLAGWCWVFSVVHAQMGPCSYIELRGWRCRTNRRSHHSDMPRTSGTHRNTWTDGFGCRHTMLAEYHHCQHLKMWNPSKRRRRSNLNRVTKQIPLLK